MYIRSYSTGNYKRTLISSKNPESTRKVTKLYQIVRYIFVPVELSKIGQSQPRYGYHKKCFSSFVLIKVQEIIVTIFNVSSVYIY